MRAFATCDCGARSPEFGTLVGMAELLRAGGWAVALDWPRGEKCRAYRIVCPAGHEEPACRLVVATVAREDARETA
jgi:hypothetical protein